MNKSTNAALALLKASLNEAFVKSPSNFGRWLQPRVLNAIEGSLSFEYTIREEMTNPAQILHGGVIAGIIDDCIGATVLTLGEDHFRATVNLNIDYFIPVKPGDVVVAKTLLVKLGKNIANVRCELSNKNGEIVASGSSSLLKTKVPINF